MLLIIFGCGVLVLRVCGMRMKEVEILTYIACSFCAGICFVTSIYLIVVALLRLVS